jgi:hypothetical protein
LRALNHQACDAGLVEILVFKIVMKKLLLVFACSVGVIALLGYASGHGRLSPRGLGTALLVLCIAIGATVVFISKKSGKEFSAAPGPSGTSIDADAHKQLLWRIRMAKITVATMGIALGLGLIHIREFPLSALLVGLVMNLVITARAIQTILRLHKHLRAGSEAK